MEICLWKDGEDDQQTPSSAWSSHELLLEALEENPVPRLLQLLAAAGIPWLMAASPRPLPPWSLGVLFHLCQICPSLVEVLGIAFRTCLDNSKACPHLMIPHLISARPFFHIR